MSRKVDIAFCILLFVGSLGHLFGTFKFNEIGSVIFVWSLSGALAAFLLAYLNVVRLWYPSDRRISFVTAIGCIFWIYVVFLFGQTLKNLFDPRVIIHAVAAAGLLLFSLKTAFLRDK